MCVKTIGKMLKRIFGRRLYRVVDLSTFAGSSNRILPKFNSPEERIEYVHQLLKEIGPISKYSAIEDDDDF